MEPRESRERSELEWGERELWLRGVGAASETVMSESERARERKTVIARESRLSRNE